MEYWTPTGVEPKDYDDDDVLHHRDLGQLRLMSRAIHPSEAVTEADRLCVSSHVEYHKDRFSDHYCLLYTADLGGLASKLGLSSHFYADDTQLYTTGTRSESVDLQRRMEHGVDELAGWMKSNRLLLNPPKTDFLWCATPRRCNQLSTVPLEVCGVRVPPTGTVRDLGILLEADMQMTGHVRQLVLQLDSYG